jgi:hypothetical protein
LKNLPSVFPYPFISIFSSDYEVGIFDVDFELLVDSVKSPITLRGDLDLSNEELVEALAEGSLSIYVDVVSTSSFFRKQFQVPQLRVNAMQLIQDEKFEIMLPAGSLVGTVELTAYLVAAKDLSFSPAGLHADYGDNVFQISIGDLLGASPTKVIELIPDFGATPDLVTLRLSTELDPNSYVVDTNGNIIQVLMGKNYMDYWSLARTEASSRSQLWLGLYKDVLVAALAAASSAGLENVESVWAKRLLNQLESLEISLDDSAEFSEINRVALEMVGKDGVEVSLRVAREPK